MTTYLATINTPGYLPWDDDPPTFEDAKAAWEYLLDHRRNAEDDDEHAAGYSSTKNTLECLARGDLWEDMLDPLTGEGSVHGDTPGYDGDHDLGLIYSVTITEEDGS